MRKYLALLLSAVAQADRGRAQRGRAAPDPRVPLPRWLRNGASPYEFGY